MKIKLIQPAMMPRPMDTKLKTRMSPSLALLTIANLTPKEHEVIIENENVENIDFDENVDLVAITVTVDVMNRAVEISKEFQKRGVKVIAGGIHITADPEGAPNSFDAIIIGMAERVWEKVLKDVENNSIKKIYYDMENIRGNEIVSPDYGMIDNKKYLYTNIISTSRGCPFKCDFCYNSCAKSIKTYVNRPIEDVIKDIKVLKTKHIMFIDDNFIGNPKWTKELLKEIKPLKLKWNAAVTSNIVDMPELLDEMKGSGCQSLFIGFESINGKSIESVHKIQNSVSRYEKLVDEIHKRGIMINASFVFGLDEDDAEIFNSTLEWIVKNKIETVTSHIMTPYPGTKLYASLLKENRIVDHNLSNYNTSHVVYKPKNMTAEELYNGYLWIYKEVYTFKNIMKRLPKSKKQWIPFLAFNLLYRKFGKLTELVCNIVSFEVIGRLSRWVAYRIK
ncbi:B12-binding domain-containing radical SAM protein [Clostridium sp. 2-1]|uniref:B12-binding domain-containing radical SAM protein n=1 Tax=Clostridium TaxID=1485 RepID=UPI000CDB5139|nr:MULTISPECIES: radical SAM protein [Clostridium]MBN7576830.1 B12-binding domain-containing radical SAM protein [Clostridium beijerinckii]MBN7581874.1 B12-binding domain-containing radical SAM protein [Clostridium beijerinckii]MBN7586610.1 B12-binding domain-containing radical SAM protein [Clostridium beijerinckii]MBO0522754.1 B12-binding domain-containing radical SAM protein [Clostridium beijerinckii]POO89568.1 B12-binding domain-containing radical SAM protein [Clostridium sp. 2-1]